jgi:hypothetical protein
MHYIKSLGKYVFYDDNNVAIIARINVIGANYAQSWKQNLSLHKSRENGGKESHDDEEKENN